MSNSNHNLSTSFNSEVEDIPLPSAAEIAKLQQKKFPVFTLQKNKKVFDSADYFMEQDKDRKHQDHADATHEVAIPDYHSHNKGPVFRGRNQRKNFDSADYFMEQAREQQRAAENPVDDHAEINAIPEYPGNKAPVFKRRRQQEKKTFDSADYFMKQAHEKQTPALPKDLRA